MDWCYEHGVSQAALVYWRVGDNSRWVLVKIIKIRGELWLKRKERCEWWT